MPDYENLDIDIADGIATLTVARPDKLNALDHATMKELESAGDRLRGDDAVRGIIITGQGSKAFVAGADIAELAAQAPLDALETSRLGQRIFRDIELSRKPTVAAVNGFALGGGCELALACHLRVASTTARFGLPEVKLGLIPGYGGNVRLPRLVGRGRALELILTGAMIDAEEAHRIGLINQVVDPDSLLAEARSLLDTILANGPVAVSMAIDAVVRGADLDAEAALALEANHFGLLAATDDVREGTAAFLEKRSPDFRGKGAS